MHFNWVAPQVTSNPFEEKMRGILSDRLMHVVSGSGGGCRKEVLIYLRLAYGRTLPAVFPPG
jgi:hypothetical protein